jgi:Ser/Thr protein kinase RdoA (MazF antagonist)
LNVLHAWGLQSAQPVQVSGGLINQTWRVLTDEGPLILQRLNTDIFSPLVHHDIALITNKLSAAGMITPRLVPTQTGALWHTQDGGAWRLMTEVGERTIQAIGTLAEAESAGKLVGCFHATLGLEEVAFQSVRPGAHDTSKHMATMATAVSQHPDHRLARPVQKLVAEIATRWGQWSGDLYGAQQRVIHGDLKISNLRFSGEQAVALIDLDTMAMSTLDVELGDAMRSWCNRGGEDAAAGFDLDIFGAAMRGYAQGSAHAPPTSDEIARIPAGVLRITLELSARFAADALNECYFGFDPNVGDRGEHNLVRAQGQLSLANSVQSQLPEMLRLVQLAFDDAKD